MWSMKFKILPYIINDKDTNLIHATTSNNFADNGVVKIDFVGKTSKLRVCYPPFGKGLPPYCITSPVQLPLGRMTTIQLQRRPGTFDSQLIVKANGIQVFSVGDPLPKEAESVNVYMSNPVMTPASAIMEEYQFFTGKINKVI